MFPRTVLIVLSIPLFSGLTVLAVQETPSEKDKKLMQGKWQLVSYILDGEERVKPGEKLYILIEGYKIKSTDGMKTSELGTFSLDATKTPKTIDYLKAIFRSGPGIYELNGDDLKVCTSAAGKERPKEFSSTAKNGQDLRVLKRVKN